MSFRRRSRSSAVSTSTLGGASMAAAKERRIGIFGGTFDPVHLGHLILAEQCREQGRLDQVWFLPSAHPPHKPEGHLTRFDQRVEMLQLALAGHEAFRVEEVEKELPAPGHTADTVTELRRR